MKTILIVDDQPELLEILKTYLVSRKFNVLVAVNGKEAIDIVSSEKRVDLVIMDIMMPRENGYDVTKKIRLLKLDYYLPILILTAKTELNDALKGFESGADDFITKPYELKDVLARIETNLRRSDFYGIQNLNSTETEMLEAVKNDSESNSLEKKIFYLKNLFEMSHELHSNLEYQALIDNAMFSLISHLGCKSASLLSRSKKDQKKFVPTITKGLLLKRFSETELIESENILSYFKTNKYLNLKELRMIDSPLVDDFKRILTLDVELIIPLKTKNAIEGFILLGERIKQKRYNPIELDVLYLYADAFSVALHNSKCHEKQKMMSYTDTKTGLHNDRYMYYRLNEEFARSTRMKLSLSVVMIDIDHFKNYNDTLGHLAGDNTLRMVADALTEEAREEDIVCRYGGEEFIILLPNTDEKAAYVVAERIRKRIYEIAFLKEEVQPGGTLTCSFGISTFPLDTNDSKDLIDCADKAMYQAKKTGRNKVLQFHSLVEEVL